MFALAFLMIILGNRHNQTSKLSSRAYHYTTVSLTIASSLCTMYQINPDYLLIIVQDNPIIYRCRMTNYSAYRVGFYIDIQ